MRRGSCPITNATANSYGSFTPPETRRHITHERIGAMTHCRYCNRFCLVCLAGRGTWLLECGHRYLPLPSEGQRWAAYTTVDAIR